MRGYIYFQDIFIPVSLQTSKIIQINFAWYVSISPFVIWNKIRKTNLSTTLVPKDM